jgi:hypothetical protein
LKMCCLSLVMICIFAIFGAVQAAPAPTCASLREKNAPIRWMSVPMSRIVVNPFGLEPITLPEGLAPCLKTDLAYYGGEYPIKLPCFWAWRLAGEPSAQPEAIDGPAADFSSSASSKWIEDRAAASFKDNEMKLTITEANYGSATSEFTVDLDATPYLVLQVSGTDGQWALKLNDGTRPDVSLEMGAWGPGTYTYDVREATGWSGKKTFRVLLFSVGKPGSWTTFSGLRFVGTPGNAPCLAKTSYSWAPHALESTAQFTDPGVKIDSTVFLPDESTVAQIVHVTEGGPTALVLTGQFSHAQADWDAAHNAVVIKGEHYTARISLGRAARWLGTRDSWPGLLAGKPQPDVKSGVWAVAIDDVKAGDEIVVEARFAPDGEKLPKKAPDLSIATVRQALKQREADWDKRLATVPQPLSFDLHKVDAKDVTTDAIRRMYYKAWVFLLSDTLPPMPDNDYAYPQVGCGKPSLWAEGHPRSRQSAQWESMIGMQFLSWADPEAAWASFEGMMTLVDKDGIMGGEGLPSRHVQTAWTLYTVTGDAKRLANVYPALKRLLLWKISDPRWVFHGLVAPGNKDFEFVVHALIDADFAIRIAKVLNMPEEEKLWQTKIKELAANADKWFYDDNGSGPYEMFDANTNTRSAFHNSWTLQAIVLPKGLLSEAHEKSNLDLFKSMLNPNAPFAGMVLAKHPSYEFITLGAWNHGLADDAAVMAEAIMREITMAGEFSECYSFTFPPNTEGVIPSLFGVANIIDGALWHNGIIVGEGLPIIVHVPGAKGVENIRLRGGKMSVRFGSSDDVEISGKGLEGLRMPSGFTASDGPTWRGKLPVGKEITLEEL